MTHLNPYVLLATGFMLLLIGFILPVLMLLHRLESTFLLNFFSYGALTLGMMLGFIGSISLAARNWKK